MRFFTGLHHPSDARHVQPSFISVNSRLRDRKSDFEVGDWILDSGAFSTIKKYGGYPWPVEEYAAQIRRWSSCGNLLAAVSQDYMCEAWMVERTGLSIAEHQRLTIERYDELVKCDVGGVYIMPVLQGFAPEDYVSHIEQYGARLRFGSWVGVGSVCKRNGNIGAIEAVLGAIKNVRHDLRLHGFGLKETALSSGFIRDRLHTADSMAWSFRARMEGRNANDWREALRFRNRINTMPVQAHLWGLVA